MGGHPGARAPYRRPPEGDRTGRCRATRRPERGWTPRASTPGRPPPRRFRASPTTAPPRSSTSVDRRRGLARQAWRVDARTTRAAPAASTTRAARRRRSCTRHVPVRTCSTARRPRRPRRPRRAARGAAPTAGDAGQAASPPSADRHRHHRRFAGLARRRRRTRAAQAGHHTDGRAAAGHAGGARERVAGPARRPHPAPTGRHDRRRRHGLGDRRDHRRRGQPVGGGLRPGHRHLEDRHSAAGSAVARDGRDLPRGDHCARRLAGAGRQPHGGELEQGVRPARRRLGRAAADAVAARRGRCGRRRRRDHRQRWTGRRQAQPHHRGVRRQGVASGRRPAHAARAPGHGHRRHVAYVVGGRDLSSDKNSAALERYDPKTDSWAALAPMPAPRGGIGAAVADGRLVVAGGEEPTTVDDTVFAYDIPSNTWSDLPPMPSAGTASPWPRSTRWSTRSAAPPSPATPRRPAWARRCRCPRAGCSPRRCGAS